MNALAGLRHNFVMPTNQEVVKNYSPFLFYHSSLIYLGLAKYRAGFWHAPAKRGLRTKDHAGRYRVSDDEDPQGLIR